MQGGRGLGEVIAEHGLIWQRLHAGDAMLGADTAAMVDGRPSTAAASSRSRLSSQRRRLWDSPEASKLHAARCSSPTRNPLGFSIQTQTQVLQKFFSGAYLLASRAAGARLMLSWTGGR